MKNIVRTLAFVMLILHSTLYPFRLSALDNDSGNQQIQSDLRTMHSGKAGIYVRLGKGARRSADSIRNVMREIGRDGQSRRERRRGRRREQEYGTQNIIQTHPLVDAVVLPVSWRQIEPERGVYAFDSLLDEVNQWARAGKGVVIAFELYGQEVADALTPPWIYEQAGVREISFQGGGRAKGRLIRVPAVWDEGFVEKYVEPLVAAFAKTFDGNSSVWYIMPGFGHIGNITAQPSRDGSRAFLESGWTPEKWSDYCRRTIAVYKKHFRRTPLLLKSAGMFIRDRRENYYQQEAAQLLTEFGRQGVAIIHFGLDADRELMAPVYRDLEGILSEAQRGITRIGLGDDWPLWVPESRRQHGPTGGHDEEYLRKALDNAFGGIDGIPQIPVTIIFCQEPEILASHPSSLDYRPEVADLLKKAQEHLKKNDRALFGTA